MSDSTTTVIEDGERQTAPGFGTARAVLKPRKARPFYSRHPWVLDSAIQRIEGEPADGDVIELVSEAGKFIARGVYNSRSRIRVRLVTWNHTEAIDDSLWRRRLHAAIDFRRQLGFDVPGGASRLVYSEADGLSGLIVDRYADWLAVQVTGLSMAQRLPQIVPMLVEMTQPRGVLIRTEKGVSQAEGIELRDGLYWGEMPTGPVFVEENSIRYGIDLAEGQKTGFYLDQRENRRVAASYFRDRRIVDICCYSGGFSLNASILGGAREVLAFDSSQKAIALARANAQLNGAANIHCDTSDCFAALENLGAAGQKFGGVVVDPPKFARSRQAVDEAMRAYHRLNRLAVDVLEPGGILVTCSCSGHVTREDFLFMLVGVAQQTRREIQVLDQRGGGRRPSGQRHVLRRRIP